MKYQAVMFDLDGTLMDTSPGVISAIDYVVAKYNLPELTDKEKRSFIGPPIQKSFQKYYNLSDEKAWKIATEWREVYRTIFLTQAAPYKDIDALLQCLRLNGSRTAVVTNKREDYTLDLLGHFELIPLFDYIIGSDFEGNRTKSDMISMCIGQFAISNPKLCLMVGDTKGDYDAAQTAGVDFLGVTYGFGFEQEESNSPFKLVKNCEEMMQFLKIG